MPNPELEKHFICDNTGNLIQSPVLMLKNKTWVAVERDSVPKSYIGPIYEAPLLKAEIERSQVKTDRPFTLNKAATRYIDKDGVLSFILVGSDEAVKQPLVDKCDCSPDSKILPIGMTPRYKKVEFGDNSIKTKIYDLENNQYFDKWFTTYQSPATAIILAHDVTNSNYFSNSSKLLDKIYLKLKSGTPILIVSTNSNGVRNHQEKLDTFVEKNRIKCPRLNFLQPFVINANDAQQVDQLFSNLSRIILMDLSWEKAAEPIITGLKNYIETRNNDGREYFHGFLSKTFGGHSKEQKLLAAETLIDVLEGKKTRDFLGPFEKVLNQGRLSDIYKKAKTELFDDWSLNKVSQYKI